MEYGRECSVQDKEGEKGGATIFFNFFFTFENFI